MLGLWVTLVFACSFDYGACILVYCQTLIWVGKEKILIAIMRSRILGYWPQETKILAKRDI